MVAALIGTALSGKAGADGYQFRNIHGFGDYGNNYGYGNTHSYRSGFGYGFGFWLRLFGG